MQCAIYSAIYSVQSAVCSVQCTLTFKGMCSLRFLGRNGTTVFILFSFLEVLDIVK